MKAHWPTLPSGSGIRLCKHPHAPNGPPVAMPDEPRKMHFAEVNSPEWKAWKAAGFYAGAFQSPTTPARGWDFPDRWPPAMPHPAAAAATAWHDDP